MHDAEAYLGAFMNGFEFVLLAIRGRLEEADLGAEERARLEAFLADYFRIAQAYRARHPAPAPAGLSLQGVFPVQVEPVTAN